MSPAPPPRTIDRQASRRARGLLAVGVALLVGAASAHARANADGAGCFPACRAGFLCHDGQCLSACNPPCAAGETCTSSGECTLLSPASLAAIDRPLTGEPQAPPVAAEPAADPGWARGASYFGFASAGVDVALTAAVIATNPHHPGTSRTIGSWAIAVFGVTVPLTALGGASARGNSAVVGRPRLRIASWVAYGLALVDSAYLLSRSRIAIIDNRTVVFAGVLGAFSATGFAIDAHSSAIEAEAARASARPTLSFAATAAGAVVPTCGLAGAF